MIRLRSFLSPGRVRQPIRAIGTLMEEHFRFFCTARAMMKRSARFPLAQNDYLYHLQGLTAFVHFKPLRNAKRRREIKGHDIGRQISESFLEGRQVALVLQIAEGSPQRYTKIFRVFYPVTILQASRSGKTIMNQTLRHIHYFCRRSKCRNVEKNVV